MGWTLLYIAFGAVAVWLLAEVLLQYKARLRWRLLAFGGFAMVVVGVVLLSSVVVISLGAAAFAVGQTFVTLSYRRGFTAGWALGGMPGTSKRRREVRPLPPEDAEPHLEVSDLRPEPPRDQPAYRPEPLPDDTVQYGVYERDRPAEPQQDPQDRYAGADWAGHPGYGTDGQGSYGDQDGGYGGGYGYGGGGEYGYSDPYTGVPAQPSYEGQPYATASDAGPGAQGYAPGPSYPSDGYGTGYTADPYGGAQQPYADHLSSDTVWMPQQRDDEPQTGQYGHGHPQDGGYDTSSGTGYYYGEQRPRY
ncbi:hypothetical protein [Streptomyces macrosporus]|uniref:Integral membrane protein n=1 Tax=Streptomyces macrosporus TaxID=44032 RepID=A0ABP5X3R4_9ACTN